MSQKTNKVIWDTQEKYFQISELAKYGFEDFEIRKLTGLAKSSLSYILHPSTREKTKTLARVDRIELANTVRDYKLEKKCLDCGFNGHAEALDLDHYKEMKNFSIAYGIRYKSKSQVLAELAFCEVRCANCHRYKTFAEERNLSKKESMVFLYTPELFARYEFDLKSKFIDNNYKAIESDTRKLINEYVFMLKESSPCMDCNISHRYFAMDYDHVRGEKVANINKLLKLGINKFHLLLKEIAKCDLVCASCHRIRSSNRRSKQL